MSFPFLCFILLFAALICDVTRAFRAAGLDAELSRGPPPLDPPVHLGAGRAPWRPRLGGVASAVEGVVGAAAVADGGRRAVGVGINVVAAGALLVRLGRGAGRALGGAPLLL